MNDHVFDYLDLAQLYWQIGKCLNTIDYIFDKTNKIAKALKQRQFDHTDFRNELSLQLRCENPTIYAYSRYNMRYMCDFARGYPRINFETQAIAHLPWGDIIRVMEIIRDKAKRESFAREALRNHWSRFTLLTHIETDVFGHEVAYSAPP